MELFARIVDGMDRELGIVYLQGWGEPLLNPNLSEMIKLVKERSDATVGLTTNGTLLEEKAVGKILDAGLDVIGISFAGAEGETHDGLRLGCDFDRVVGNATALVKRKRLTGERLRVVASYVMTKQNIHEVPRFVILCGEIGIDEIVFDNLTYMPSTALSASRAFSDPGEEADSRAERYVEEAKELGASAGVRVFAYGLSCKELATCPEGPTRTMFVSVDGEVSPCVFTNMPTSDPKIPRYFAGRPSHIDKLAFGNGGVEDLHDVWNRSEYIQFREAFERRTKVVEDVSELLTPVLEPTTDMALPEPCRTCYRILNV